MLTYTYISKGKFGLVEKPKPMIQHERDAIVKVTLASICSSDLHIKHGSVPRAVEGITVGHEMVGIVEEVGSAVTHVKPGDRVTVNVETFCGECFFCKKGFVNNCTDKNGGWALGCRIDGGQAEYVRVPFADQGLNKIPDTVTDRQALLVGDVLATGYWAAKISEITEDDLKNCEKQVQDLTDQFCKNVDELSKVKEKEILELYLNNIPFGNQIEGIGSASRFFYSCTPKQLSQAQTLCLATIPRRPTYYSPAVDEKNSYSQAMLLAHELKFNCSIDEWVKLVRPEKNHFTNRHIHFVKAIINQYARHNKIVPYEVNTFIDSKLNDLITDNINSKIIAFAFALAAEIERNLISQRTKEALAVKRLEGIKLGRPPGSSKKKEEFLKNLKDIRKMMESGHSMSRIAKFYGIHRNTLRRYLQDFGS